LFIAAFVVITRGVLLFIGVEVSELQAQTMALGATFIETPGQVITNSLSAGPLFIFFSGLINFVLGGSAIASVIITAVLVFLQALILNTVLQRNNSLIDNTYLPGILYVFILSLNADFLFLSPILLANTFLLLAIDKILTHLKYRGTEENILSTGFLLGLSALCYIPYFTLLVFAILIYIIYSSTLVRRYFLMTYGFIFSFSIFWIYYLAFGEGGVFIEGYFTQLWNYNTVETGELQQMLITMGLPALLTILSGAKSFSSGGLTNHQMLTQRMMLWLLIVGLVVLRLDQNFAGASMLGLVIPITFFTAQFFITREKKWVAELFFWIVFIGALALMFSPFY